MDCFS